MICVVGAAADVVVVAAAAAVVVVVVASPWQPDPDNENAIHGKREA